MQGRITAILVSSLVALLCTGAGVALGQSSGGVGTGGTGGTSTGGHPWVFPVHGAHTYGDGFGAARAGHRHQGQDIMANCGVPVVAVHSGKIQQRARQSAAGYYLVLDVFGTGRDYAYMHLRKRHRLAAGTRVTVGQRIGYVGKTGDATACHLHFEKWTSPGYYQGGHPTNPIKELRRWDQYS